MSLCAQASILHWPSSGRCTNLDAQHLDVSHEGIEGSGLREEHAFSPTGVSTASSMTTWLFWLRDEGLKWFGWAKVRLAGSSFLNATNSQALAPLPSSQHPR